MAVGRFRRSSSVFRCEFIDPAQPSSDYGNTRSTIPLRLSSSGVHRLPVFLFFTVFRELHPAMASGESSTAATEPTATVPLSTVFRADDADAVIRAAGTRDFRVHKVILSLVSPVFKDMFTLPQPASDTLPHIDVQESPETWSNILHTIYRMPNPTINNLDDLGSLLLAAKKYDIQFIIDVHEKGFENREFIKENPLRLYGIACACELEDQAEYVARHADTLTVVRQLQDNVLNGVPVTAYYRLITFLVERDNELHPILEQGWKSFESCECLQKRRLLYKRTKEKLSTPYIQMDEVYLRALEDRSFFRDEACSVSRFSECAVKSKEIKGFLKRMFAEKERVCDKFMWEW